MRVLGMHGGGGWDGKKRERGVEGRGGSRDQRAGVVISGEELGYAEADSAASACY